VKIAFLDTETTGLEREDEIIELHIQIWDSSTTGLVPGAEFYRLWYPVNLPSDQAAKVNGFRYSTWQERGATMFTGDDVKALWRFLDEHKPDSWGGCNVQFDLMMLENMTRRAREPRITLTTHRIIGEVQALAAPLIVAGKLKSASLASLCQYFGVQNEGQHTAKGDCLATLQVFERLIGTYWPALGVAA
jgi:DNA polymerase III epsilon subunit-like protein